MITSPTQISNCVVWLDATDTTTLSSLSGGAGNSLINTSLTGDFVGGWGDKSGNSRHFTNIGGSASTRPTWIAALSTVRFDGVNDYLTSLFNLTYTAQTVFVVTSPITHGLTIRGIYAQAAASATENATYSPLFQHNTTLSVASLAAGSDSNARSIIYHRSLNAFDILTSNHTGNSILNFKNGESSTASFAHTLGSFSTVVHRIGARINGTQTPSAYYNGDVCEVIVYSKSLSNAEREDVEYYLARKWSFLTPTIPRQVYALKSGNWSDSTLWSVSADPSPFNFPLSADTVYTNSFAVTINQNVSVSNFKVDALDRNFNPTSPPSLSPNILNGGNFLLAGPFTIRGDVWGGSTTCLIAALSSSNPNATLFGNVFGTNLVNGSTVVCSNSGSLNIIGNIQFLAPPGGNSACKALENNSTGTISITGNVFGTSGANVGITNNSTGTINISGQIIPAATTSAAHCVLNNSTGTINFIGEALGGPTTDTPKAILNSGPGNVYITGTVRGGATGTPVQNGSIGAIVVRGNIIASGGGGILQSSTGTLLVSGDIFASANAHGVISSNTGARNEFTGSLVNDLSGRQAVYAARYLLRPQMFNSFTRVAGPSATNTPIFYYAPESYNTSFVPHASSVAVGTAYAAVSSLSGVAVNIPVQLSGTMVVPSVGSVDRGKLVGPSGVGTAIITTESLQKVWDINTATLTATNSIGSRLSNTATIEQVGQQIQTLNI